MTTTCLAVLVDRANDSRIQAELRRLLETPQMRVVLVVSSGDLPALPWVSAMTDARGADCSVLSLPPELPRGEAVRAGLNAVLERMPDLAGYISDGFATPAEEVLRVAEIMRARGCSVVLGARVAMLGTDIRRSAARHYLGRVFAMLASTVLGLAVYDTQCGLKLFRPSPVLRAALARPFISTIAFDVELLARLLAGGPGADRLNAADIVEVPLRRWAGSSGSIVNARDVRGALSDLLRIRLDVRRP